MISKIFPFNKTLFKKDWKIIGWWSYLATAILFLMAPMHNMRMLNKIRKLRESLPEIMCAEEICSLAEIERNLLLEQHLGWHLTGGFKEVFSLWNNPWQGALLLLFPLLIAVLLIGEERRKKTFDFLSVIPYTRGEIFFNKIAVGCAALLLPYAVNGAFMYLMRYVNEYIGGGYAAVDVTRWLLVSLLFMGAIFAFGIFVGMIAGSSLAHYAFSMIFLWFPWVFANLLLTNLGLQSVQDVSLFKLLDFAQAITIPIYVFDRQFFDENFAYRILGLLLFATISMILAKLLFDRNKMERNGEVLMFGNLEKIFRYGVTVCTILLLGPFFGTLIFAAGNIPALIVGYIISALLGWFITGYLIKRNRVGV